MDPDRIVAVFHIALDFLTAGFQPMQEPFQRHRMFGLVGKRRRKKLIDRVARLGAKPGQQLLATTVGPEQRAEQFVGPQEIGLSPVLAQTFVGGAKIVALPGGGLAAPAKACFGAHGQARTKPPRPSRPRTLEHGRQGQVVLRQEQHSAEGDQIHDRQLLGQDHAIDSGDRHVALLQGPHQGIDETAAPPYQNQNVAGCHASPAGLKLGLGIIAANFGAGPVPDPLRDQVCQPTGRLG